MKLAVAALALLALLPAGPSLAHEKASIRLNPDFDCNEPTRWAQRHAAGEARIAITTEDGKVTLLLTDRVVAIQLSDRTMRKLDRELHRARHEDEDDDGPLGEAIKAAVIGAVKSMLDHSAECPLRELRDVRYEDGRLEIIARDGDRIFDRLEVDDDDVLESFDARDAEAFVREFHRLKAGSR